MNIALRPHRVTRLECAATEFAEHRLGEDAGDLHASRRELDHEQDREACQLPGSSVHSRGWLGDSRPGVLSATALQRLALGL